VTAPTRASLVAAVVDGAATAWNRWAPFYGSITGPITGRAKAPAKVMGLLAVVVSGALTFANPAWSLGLDLDAKQNPVCLWVRNGDDVRHVPITIDRRRVRFASPGWGERETAPIALAGPKAGQAFLDALATTAAAILVPVEMDRRGRGRDV